MNALEARIAEVMGRSPGARPAGQPFFTSSAADAARAAQMPRVTQPVNPYTAFVPKPPPGPNPYTVFAETGPQAASARSGAPAAASQTASPVSAVAKASKLGTAARFVGGKVLPVAALASSLKSVYDVAAGGEDNDLWSKAKQNMAPLRQSLAEGNYGVSSTPGKGAVSDLLYGLGGNTLAVLGLQDYFTQPAGAPVRKQVSDKVAPRAENYTPEEIRKLGTTPVPTAQDAYMRQMAAMPMDKYAAMVGLRPKPRTAKDTLTGQFGNMLLQKYMQEAGNADMTDEQKMASEETMFRRLGALLGADPWAMGAVSAEPE